jgi:hypothetical protein
MLTFMAGGILIWRGTGRLCYEGKTVLVFSGDPKQVDRELNVFQSENVHKRIELALARPSGPVTFAKVPGHPLEISIRGQGAWPAQVVKALEAAAKVCMEQSLARRKAELHKDLEGLQIQKLALEARRGSLELERKTFLSSSGRKAPHGNAAAGILGRQVNETRVRIDYFSQRLQDLSKTEQNLKPAWKVIISAQSPSRPSRMEEWPLFSGVLAGVFLLGFVLTTGKAKAKKAESPNGLWRPNTDVRRPTSEVRGPVDQPTPDVARRTLETPVELTVVPAEPPLPSDPMTEKAATIYAKWIEVAKVLYAPAPEPPQGILDSVGPLLQESSEFLAEGYDVLARYLAQTVAPGDLPAHVARTVLMTLAGAEEAGVSPEHRLAMALAALFHDLAVVARPAAIQEEAGSEVGRLSASVLRRIPGLQPAILSMVEEILIGMDEFKLETWQNVASGKNLEPLSKVLREIDRFEKVMQKQKSRIARQITRKTA